MTNSPTDTQVTVLMPVRAETADNPRLQDWFEQALASLQQQTYSGMEILLIGDADRRVERWMPKPLARLPGVELVSRPEPGIVSALNTGLQQATTPLVARMDSDDIAHPERIRLQVELLQQYPDIDFSATTVGIFNESGSTAVGNQQYQLWLNQLRSPDAIRRGVFIESPCPHPSWMLRRSLFNQLGGYRDVDWAEDYDLVLRAYLANVKMAKPGFDSNARETHNPEANLVSWRDHDVRLTRSDDHYSRHNFIRAKAWALSKSLLNETNKREAIIIGTGTNAKRLHDALVENNIRVSCFVELNAATKKQSLRQLPVINYDELSRLYDGSALIVSAVTRYNARNNLRQWFDEHGMREELDFVFAG